MPVHCLNGLYINDIQMLTRALAHYLEFITWPSDDIPIGGATCCWPHTDKASEAPHLR